MALVAFKQKTIGLGIRGGLWRQKDGCNMLSLGLRTNSPLIWYVGGSARAVYLCISECRAPHGPLRMRKEHFDGAVHQLSGAASVYTCEGVRWMRRHQQLESWVQVVAVPRACQMRSENRRRLSLRDPSSHSCAPLSAVQSVQVRYSTVCSPELCALQALTPD